MTMIEEIRVTVDNRAVRALAGGHSGDRPVLLLHGGIPGKSLYCGGAHMWRPVMAMFASNARVVALDLPGCGGSELGDGVEDYTVSAMGRCVLGALHELELEGCHVVGTDLGGLLALWLALETPSALSSITIAASHITSPTGDSQENLVLAHPPRPLWSRESQAWALERISYAHHHIDEVLLDGCARNAEAAPHREAARIAQSGGFEERFLPSVLATKGRFYSVTRDRGVEVPTQIVWGERDPLSRLENGMTLFRIIAEKQRLSQFHVLARVGALPFHEEPEAFHSVVRGFHRGLDCA